MKKLKLTAAAVALAVLCASAEELHQALTPPANAALYYWLAIVEMPELNEDEQKLLHVEYGIPGPERTQLARKLKLAMSLLRQGAKIEACDWGTEDDGISRFLSTSLLKRRELLSAASLSAFEYFTQKDYENGVECACDAMALARHMGRNANLLTKMMELAMTEESFQPLAYGLPRIPRELLKKLDERLDKLPKFLPLSETVRNEGKITAWLRKNTATDELAASALKTALRDGNAHTAEWLKNPQALRSMLPPTNALFDEIEKVVDLPYERTLLLSAELVKAEKEAGPLMNTMVASFVRCRHENEEVKARWALFRAGIRVALEGKSVLETIVDPNSKIKGPFIYRELPGGFELTSRLAVFNEEDVRMTFGVLENPPPQSGKKVPPTSDDKF